MGPETPIRGCFLKWNRVIGREVILMISSRKVVVMVAAGLYLLMRKHQDVMHPRITLVRTVVYELYYFWFLSFLIASRQLGQTAWLCHALLLAPCIYTPYFTSSCILRIGQCDDR